MMDQEVELQFPKQSNSSDTSSSIEDGDSPPQDSPELKVPRLLGDFMDSSAAKPIMIAALPNNQPTTPPPPSSSSISEAGGCETTNTVNFGDKLSMEEANRLFSIIFGESVSEDILQQWSNQGIRFSPDPETSMGLVQHEGGPCGVLATLQGFVLKYLLFVPEEPKNSASRTQQSSPEHEAVTPENFASLSEHTRRRALVLGMAEILIRCGDNNRAVIATLDALDQYDEGTNVGPRDEIIAKALEDFSIKSASDLQKTLRVASCNQLSNAIQSLEMMLPIFESRMGAMLFLISALLSRGLDSIQSDRDDPSLPLVTSPFGHASQEIVNLLLCGQAVANVFDETTDLGGGMFLKGICTDVEVGFLTLLEHLNFCKVGQRLKHPKWPIWVVGSESHYTVLFAFDPSVQDENEMEVRESKIKRAFDAQDQSGGGGFISIDGLHQVLKETAINLPSDKLNHLCSAGFVLWSEFWQVLLHLDKNLGGFGDSSCLKSTKKFEMYHFNGIAKTVSSGNQGGTPFQRPRLTKLRVSVPPRRAPEEFTLVLALSSFIDNEIETEGSEPSQHAPLVDCIRTRWDGATCNWDGDPPSIV